jgi:hypothetical protein
MTNHPNVGGNVLHLCLMARIERLARLKQTVFLVTTLV